jgi:putative membrane protein
VLTAFALAATLVVALAHVAFMVLETFLWTTRRGRKIFGQTVEQAEATKVLAKNQGIYNGALAAVLAWAAFSGPRSTVVALLLFVVVVGAYGGITAKPTILVVQALPAAIALALVLLGI